MRYGVISDIHGNLEALLVAIEARSREKVDRVLCPGDVVGYGADPSECIKRTRALDPVIVCGNHDAAAAGLKDTKNFNESARKAVMWTQGNLSPEDGAFLKDLSFVYKDKHATMVHGTLQEPEAFHYMLDGNEANLTFRLMETRVCFVGHSHAPGVFLHKDKKITYSCKEKIKISKDEKAVINAGSVGQPRDGDPRLCYVIYDTDKGLIEFKRLPYDVKEAQKKILKAGLPVFLADRLNGGV